MKDDVVFLDIETAGNLDANEDLHGYLLGRVKPDGRIKDEDKKAEDIDNKRKEIVREGALRAGPGKIILLGLMDGDGAYEPYTDEAEGLKALWKCLTVGVLPTLVTGNGFKFDLPFCTQRSWQRGIPVPPVIDVYLNKHKSFHYDVMQKYACGTAFDMIKMEEIFISMVPAIPIPKWNGADMPSFYEQGMMDRIIEHNRDDLTSLRELYLRMTKRGEGYVASEKTEPSPEAGGGQEDDLGGAEEQF
jgi:hypothetical protein